MGKNLLILLLIFSFDIFAQTGGIEGFITSENEPVVGANVYLVETDYAAYSADDGFYSIKNVTAGEYKLRISSIGYETKFIDIKISPARITKLNIELKSKAIQVDEIEVIGSKIRQQSDTRASLIELKPKSAKNLPGSAEDVMRTLQSLPGVTSPNDFSTQLIIRGSGPDQNLIIMDDVEVFNPYRLYGVISMFNPEVVSEINLITGGFPAKYGDRLSAVLDVSNRAGNSEKFFSGSINANVTDANIVLEGRNPFGLVGSWIFHSRRTYYDLIIEPFVKKTKLVKENVTFPNFYDVQGKVVLSPFKNHKFILNGIYSRDGVNVISGEDRNTVDSIGVSNVTRNDLASIGWHYFPTRKFFNKVTLSWYENGGNTDLEAQVIDPSLNREAFEGVLLDTVAIYLLGFGVKSDFSFRKYSFDEKFLYSWGSNELEA
ncbi:MAG: TonB-dependent receptor, partial [Ignavibacteria bacterium]|nr:TonB-dependent receptor [Ignavibacteria bacterium]